MGKPRPIGAISAEGRRPWCRSGTTPLSWEPLIFLLVDGVLEAHQNFTEVFAAESGIRHCSGHCGRALSTLSLLASLFLGSALSVKTSHQHAALLGRPCAAHLARPSRWPAHHHSPTATP